MPGAPWTELHVNPPPVNTIIFSGKSHWAREMENTTDADLIYVARNGHIVGRYYEEGILKGFDCGFFLPTDLGWERGLGAWILLVEIVDVSASPGTAVAPVPAATRSDRQCGATLHLTPAPSQQLELVLEPEAAQ